MPESFVFVLFRAAGLAVFTMFLSFWLAGPLFMAWSELRGRISGRSFYDKCARQTALLNAYLHIVFLCVYGYGFYGMPVMDYFGVVAGRIPQLFWVAWLPYIALGSGLLSLIYLFSWRSMSGLKTAHIMLGFINAAAAFAMLPIGLTIIRVLCGDINIDTPEAMLGAPFIGTDRNFYLLLRLLAVFLCSGGLFSVLWLLLRRNKEDYGRDYYRFAISRASLWASGFAILGLLLNIGGFFAVYLGKAEIPGLSVPLSGGTVSFVFVALSVFCMALAAGTWLAVSRSAMPMRHKVSLVMAAALALLSGSAMIAAEWQDARGSHPGVLAPVPPAFEQGRGPEGNAGVPEPSGDGQDAEQGKNTAE